EDDRRGVERRSAVERFQNVDPGSDEPRRRAAGPALHRLVEEGFAEAHTAEVTPVDGAAGRSQIEGYRREAGQRRTLHRTPIRPPGDRGGPSPRHRALRLR